MGKFLNENKIIKKF